MPTHTDSIPPSNENSLATSAPRGFAFEGLEVRAIVREGEPWFVAADVARVLEIGRTDDAVRRLDDDEKGADTIRTPGGAQEMTIINESGLYSLILTSRKAAAKRFKKWVTAEVLPAIRKTGGYQAAPARDPLAILNDPAARFCGFSSRDKFIRWATAKGLRPTVRRAGARTVYRVADLRAALDAEATHGRKPVKGVSAS